MTIPLIDAHLDLSWNALSYDRDQTLPIDAIRRREVAMAGKARGNNTVSLPEMRRGGIGICLATVLARARPDVSPVKTQDRLDLDYANQTIAHAVARGQLAYYEALEARGHLKMIRDAKTFRAVWKKWEKAPSKKAPIGFVLSMEGCDPIMEPAQAEQWFKLGLRTASLAHYGPSAYAYGTGGDGPITSAGRKLLKEFARLGMILDLTHTSDTGFYQALDLFKGAVFASHNNCRALVPGDRQFSDDQVKRLVERGGVIGSVLDCWMLDPDWTKNMQSNEPSKDRVGLSSLADHMDHICQIAGNAEHVAIGSDLDGGFGTEQSPHDLVTIAGLQKLAPILKSRGYSDADIRLIFHGNWLRFFGENLPK